MICCAVGVAAVATGAIGWRRFRRWLLWLPGPRSILTSVAAAMVIITIAGVGAEHVRQHATDSIELTGDFGALPLCRGTVPAGRITDLASIEE